MYQDYICLENIPAGSQILFDTCGVRQPQINMSMWSRLVRGFWQKYEGNKNSFEFSHGQRYGKEDFDRVIGFTTEEGFVNNYVNVCIYEDLA